MKKFGIVVISASLIASLCACNGLNININNPEDKDLGNSYANINVNAPADPASSDNPDSVGVDDPDNQGSDGSENGEPSILAEADEYPQYWVYPNYENYEFVTNSDGSEKRTASVSFSNVEINSGEYNGFPNKELKEAVNQFNEDTKSGLEEELKNLSEMYSEMSAETDDDINIPTLYTNVNDGVVRADKQVFSIIRRSESYYGGAHGASSFWGKSFETATGNEIGFYDVVKNRNGLEDVIAEYLKDNYDNSMFFTAVDTENGDEIDIDALKEVISDYLDAPDSICFSITNEGIIIYFNEYFLTAYVAGHQEVKLDYKDYPKFLDGKYFENADEEYILRINKNIFYPMHFADGDKYVSFYWEKTYNEEYDFYSDTYNVMYAFGGPDWNLNQEMVLAGSFIDPELFLIKKGGKEFLYVQNHYFDGVDILQVFELGNNEFVEIKEYSGGVTIESNELKDISYSENLVFANNFEFGYADVSIRDNGLLSDVDQFTYTIYENWQEEYYYLVKFNIDAYEADENNKPTSKKTTLKSGTKVIIVATDGETYWTLLGDDDKTYSINVKSDGYGGYTMNGNSLDTYFAGSLY